MFNEERAAIAANLDLLAQIRDALPRATPRVATSREPRLDELRTSGLLTSETIDGYAQRMARSRTHPQMAAAIGAAKEITETTLKAALAALGQSVAPSPKFHELATHYRTSFTAAPKSAPDGATIQTLLEVERRAALLVEMLAPLCNKHGDGHGHVSHSANLRERHASPTADIAESYVRFVFLTLSDLGVIPLGK